MLAFSSMLNRTFTISRRTRTADGQGGWKITWNEVGTVPGRARPATSAEIQAAQAEDREISHVLYTLAGVDIQRGDLAESGDYVLEVNAIRNPSLEDHHYEIDCLLKQYEVSESA